jgi:hypothetical protein
VQHTGEGTEGERLSWEVSSEAPSPVWEERVRVERLLDGPIIHAGTHPSLGPNIQGPSLVRVPDWVSEPLARYYLYFADHKGSYIRLACADALTGPWRVHPPGSLQLADSCFPTQAPDAPPEAVARIRGWAESNGVELPHDLVQELTWPHIASPDVHVDEAGRRFVMYFHGLEAFAHQATRVATSPDGVRFRARPEILGMTYFRAFAHAGFTYALAMPGQLYRSEDGLTGFEQGPLLFNPDMRHAALWERDETLYVFWTQVGHAPERILVSTIDLSGSWEGWTESEPIEVLRPELPWEGSDAPLEPSLRSVAYGHVNQLRDPAIYEEDGRTFLVYAVAGESGLALAEVHL